MIDSTNSLRTVSTASSIHDEETTQKNAKYLIETITLILTEIIDDNQSREKNISSSSKNTLILDLVENPNQPKESKEPFTGTKVSLIPIIKFYERILKYTNAANNTLILSLIYLDRICEIDTLQLKQINIHRLIIASIVIAIKYNEDDYYDNKFYSKVGGIPLDELLEIEETFIKKINYTLFVKDEDFYKYQNYLYEYNKLQ